MSYLLDTGFFYAINDNTDAHHSNVARVVRTLRDPIILPVPVTTEVAFLVKRQKGTSALADFFDTLSQTKFQFETPVSEDYRRSAEIIRQYNDANIDFVDALIVAVAERLRITKILTVDARHFRMFRPRHTAAFEILP